MTLCPERARLEKEYEECGQAFDLARSFLDPRIGITPLNEFRSLSKAVDLAWDGLQRAQVALDRHRREHGC